MSDAPQEIRDNYEEIIPGVYALVPNEVYHASEGLSKTNLCDIDEAISVYKMRKAAPQKQTDPMLKGSAFHDLVLLPDVYKQTYLVGPTIGKATKANKQFIIDNPDRIVITVGMADDIHYMRDALYKNPQIREILESDTVLREVSMWVRHNWGDLLCKIRPDIIEGGVIYDLKSTIAPHARGFLHSVYKYKYHVQSAFYQDMADLNGLKISNFKFLVVGSKPPYLTAIYDLNNELVKEGEEIYYAALLKYRKYLDGDKWDGLDYGRETVTL
jgi:exodeoxyribonuclease VIII